MLSHFSHVQLCATPWTAAFQVPLSLGFSWQAYWSGLPFSSLGYLPNPGRWRENSSNSACWHHCPWERMSCWKRLLPVSTSPVGAQTYCLSGEQVVWPRILSNTACVLGHQAYEILCVPFKSKVSVSHSFLAPPWVRPAGLEARHSGGFLPSAGLQDGRPRGVSHPLFL